MATSSPWWRRAFWPDNALRFEAGTRVAFIGRPGSGKTTLQRCLLAGCPSVIVYDSKLHPGPDEWASAPGYQQVRHPGALRQHARAVLRVPIEWLRDTAGWKDPQGGCGWNWTLALEEPMNRGSVVVLFDEALYTLPASAGHDGAHRQFQQGRAFDVTVMVGSQLTNNMDTRVLRTAEHLISFRQIDKTELDALQAARGIDTRVLQGLRPREFAYHHEAEHRWHVFRPINPRRPGHVRRRVYIPKSPAFAAAGIGWRAHWYVKKSLRRAMLPSVLLIAALLASLTARGEACLALIGLTVYVLARRFRADWWRIEVESGPATVPAHETVPLALPAHEEPWRLRIPRGRAAGRG